MWTYGYILLVLLLLFVIVHLPPEMLFIQTYRRYAIPVWYQRTHFTVQVLYTPRQFRRFCAASTYLAIIPFFATTALCEAAGGRQRATGKPPSILYLYVGLASVGDAGVKQVSHCVS